MEGRHLGINTLKLLIFTLLLSAAAGVSACSQGGGNPLSSSSGVSPVFSASRTTLTVSTPSVTVGNTVTIRLTPMNQSGGAFSQSSLNVQFSYSGGSSTGTLSTPQRQSDGSYTATFTATSAGSAETVSATVNGQSITSTLPIIQVFVANLSWSLSQVQVASGSVIDGQTDTLTLSTYDTFGMPITTGGAIVVFNASGGTSTGSISATTDNGNGTYTATFTGLAIGTPTTIGATINGSPVTNTLPTIQVTPGLVSLSRSVVSVSSGTDVSGATETLTLTAEDANGIQETSGGLSVAFATSGGTSTGSIGAVTDNGNGTYTATFTGLVAGSATTITATIGGSSVTSTLPTVTVTPGAAALLAFAVQPVNTTSAGTISPAVQVAAKDTNGNVVTAFSGNITLAIGTNPNSGTLSGTKVVAAASGVSSFSNLSIDKAGTGYTLSATATGLTGATSAAFNITVGAVTKLAFTTLPTSAVSTNLITPAVQVSAEDAGGNLVSSYSGNITVAIGTNPGGGTLSGTLTVAATGGVSSFPDLSIDKAGTGYTLTAAATGLTGATSPAFNITVGPVSQLVFTVQPTSAIAGASLTPTVVVSAEDAGGNIATSFSSAITVAIGTNAGGGTLSGTATVTATSGVSSFSNLSINLMGVGYTLTAAATGLPTATSSGFTISAGAAAQVAFTAGPSNTGSFDMMTPSVQVSAEDAYGNLVAGYSGDITVAIGNNPSAGTLSGTLTITAFNGVSVFDDLSIDMLGTGYTLVASAVGLTGATSGAFNISVGPPVQLGFTVQPVNTAAGASITPAIQVSAQDAGGNLVNTFTGDITIGIGNNPTTTGTLSGTLTVTAVAGVASFPGISINTMGVSYSLVATSPGMSGAVSSNFNITLGGASQLAFTIQPANALNINSIAPAIQVTAEDAGGNIVTSYAGNITIAIGSNPGAGTLTGTKTVAAVAGVATFSNLKISNAGNGYTLTATAAGLTSATSALFDISIWQLVFTTQPSSTGIAGEALPTQPQVSIEDVSDVVQSVATNAVTLALYTDTNCLLPITVGTFGATTNPVNASSGVVSFSGVSYTQVQTVYIGATSPGLVSACSSAIAVSPLPATQLSFSTQPSLNVFTGGTFVTQPVVELQDQYGNQANASNSVTLAAYTDSGCSIPASGTFSASVNPLAATAGSAAFSNVIYTGNPGTIYLGASASGITSACSSAVFEIGNALIAAGNVGLFACGITASGGNVYCWGYNGYGQLGNNTTTTEKAPVETLLVSNMVGIAAGGNHTCGANVGGSVYCWGYNGQGQLGNNSTTNQKQPVIVEGVGGVGALSGIASVSAGQNFSCGVTSPGNVYCWGYNNYGQLGINNTTTKKTPVEVLGVGGVGNLSGIVSVAGGASHACALSTAGNVYCWGYNGYGQLGVGSTTTQKVPVEVTGVGGVGHLSNIINIVGAADHTCAVSSAGNVYCWGYNGYGQLGNNSTTTQKVPVEVLGVGGVGHLSNVSSVATGAFHTCGALSAGNVYCWGYNGYGQLGINSTTNQKEPLEVYGIGGVGDLSSITNITGGKYSTCALTSAGNVNCWGYNGNGQLGINSTVEQKEPVEVLGVGGVGSLSGI